ncbi:hypothetical protein D9758_015011 [Tetrapyrgos nigripes]|uniref:Uncharacterized protein n=1 Tax=Tetrapyrgos nigripes TaxID=182062 RepID=A0A8H5FKA2_9AGAR|nr:hypothetical protein D9758_015011 [Tetrapyrgos nigripes]
MIPKSTARRSAPSASAAHTTSASISVSNRPTPAGPTSAAPAPPSPPTPEELAAQAIAERKRKFTQHVKTSDREFNGKKR